MNSVQPVLYVNRDCIIDTPSRRCSKSRRSQSPIGGSRRYRLHFPLFSSIQRVISTPHTRHPALANSQIARSRRLGCPRSSLCSIQKHSAQPYRPILPCPVSRKRGPSLRLFSPLDTSMNRSYRFIKLSFGQCLSRYMLGGSRIEPGESDGTSVIG